MFALQFYLFSGLLGQIYTVYLTSQIAHRCGLIIRHGGWRKSSVGGAGVGYDFADEHVWGVVFLLE